MGDDSASYEAITGEWVLLLLAGGFRDGWALGLVQSAGGRADLEIGR
jgi:hypothetical protein